MDMMEVSPAASISGTPAPYGRACTNCSRAKAKCITAHGGRNCERCHRLNKECQPSTTVRKKHAVKKGGISKTAQLEEKLDGLVSLLKSATQTQSIPFIPETSQVSLNTDAYLAGASITPPSHSDESAMGASTARPQPTVLTPASTISYTTPISSAAQVPEPSLSQAQEYLDAYRSEKFQYFPVVDVRFAISAQELRQERPILWTAIMSSFTKSTVQQLALGNDLRAALGRKTFIEGEKSLDMLLATLVYCAWGHYHLLHKPILSTLVQLALGLVYDLGLNKPLVKESYMMLNMNTHGCPRPAPPTTRTMEERRAVIGCFLLSSSISNYFQKIDALRWTPYMDECLQMLKETKELPTDTLLVEQVKFQLLIERVSHGPWNDGSLDSIDMKGLPAFYLKALQSQLQDLKSKVPLELQDNFMMRWQIHNTELVVHELALHKTFQSPTPNTLDFHRLETLFSCLHAIKAWFDLFLTIPPSGYTGMSLGPFTHMAHCIVALYRLANHSDPDWDRSLVLQTVPLMTILEEIVAKMRQVREVAGLDMEIPTEEEDVFTKSARKIASIRSWWDSKAGLGEKVAGMGMGGRRMEPEREEVDVQQQQHQQMGEVDMWNVDYSDEAWLKEMLGPFFETYFPNAP